MKGQRKATPAAGREEIVIAEATSPCGRPIRVTIGKPCADSANCQYRPDADRDDGRCTWHGQLADYKKTGDRNVLFNRGLCGADEIGPRIGQLCTSGHHAECPVRIAREERLKREAEKPKKLSRHEMALGVEDA